MSTNVFQEQGVIVMEQDVVWRTRGGAKFHTTAFDPQSRRARWPGQLAICIALAKAHVWERLLDEQRFETITQLADHLREDISYVSRILRLMLLAPDIIEALLEGREPPGTSLEKLLQAMPLNGPSSALGSASRSHIKLRGSKLQPNWASGCARPSTNQRKQSGQ